MSDSDPKFGHMEAALKKASVDSGRKLPEAQQEQNPTDLDTGKMLTTGVHSFEREWSEQNDESVVVPGLKNLGFVGTGEYGTELLKKISNNGQEVDVSVILTQGGGTISLGIDHRIRSVLSPEMNAELNQALAETWQFLSDNGASNLETVEYDDSNTP